MITHMVWPEEINSELYMQIISQFQKCGNVVDVKFFIFHDSNMPIEELVRVFIEFER